MASRFFVFLFAFVALLLCFYAENCKVVINEVNTGSPERLKKKDFIELKMICTDDSKAKKKLQGYKLVGISAGEALSGNIQQVTIDLVVNLWNSKINERNLFTIGADGVQNIDMNTKSSYLSCRTTFSGNTQTINSFLNKGDKHIHAIALLYKNAYNFPEIVLTEKNTFINIDEKMQELIKSNLVDLVVYARKAPYDNCRIFTKMIDEYINKDYILREFDNNQKSGIDRSLNRCSFDDTSFIPEKFKLGAPTPGEENDCTGAHFLLEKHLPVLTNMQFNKAFDDDNTDNIDEISEMNDSPQCSASIDASTFENIPDDAIEKEIVKETEAASINQCSALNLGTDSGNLADELDRMNRRKRRLSETTNYEETNEWETTNKFQ